MTNAALSDLDKKTESFIKGLKPGQWRDAAFLSGIASDIEDKDLALAHRIFQRVRNLRPDDKATALKLRALNRKLKTAQPEIMSSSSAEKSPSAQSAMQLPQGDEQKFAEQVSSLFDVNTYKKWVKTPLFILVILPFLLFAFYLIVWASPRYESVTQFVIKQPDGGSTLDPTFALIAGFSGGNALADTELVKAYINSFDMIRHLDETLAISEHYSSSEYDFFNRLNRSASVEDKIDYFKARFMVEIDDRSNVVSVSVNAFDSSFANQIAQQILSRSEWYINEIGHNLAKSQLSFVQNEHALVEERLKNAKGELLIFQREHNLLDPEAESKAIQQIAYGLESQIAGVEAELRQLRASMSEDATPVIQLKEQLQSLTTQLSQERNKLTNDPLKGQGELDNSMGVGEILAQFSNLKIAMELAVQAYTSSQISLEKSRIEAYRQLKYLVHVESPTQPEDARYPQISYNLLLFLVVSLMLYGIGKIIVATVSELNQ
jgi:capsular polysaccharide transport system permease protein